MEACTLSLHRVGANTDMCQSHSDNQAPESERGNEAMREKSLWEGKEADFVLGRVAADTESLCPPSQQAVVQWIERPMSEREA